jgi:hypothetical protein
VTIPQLPLSSQRRGAGRVRLRIDQGYGPSARGKYAGTPLAVLLEAAGEIRGFADVEHVIGAAQDVHEVHDDDDAIVCGDGQEDEQDALRLAPSATEGLAQGILPEGWLAMSEPSARRRRDEGESNGGGGGSRTRT